MNGIKLACLYSYKCTRATSLGINKQLLDYIQNSNIDIIAMIKKLLSYPGYQKIAKLLGKSDCFDEQVVRAYWLGYADPRLKQINHNFETLKKIRDLRTNRHLPDLPGEIIHKMLDCAVSFGEVIDIGPEEIVVKNYRLLYDSKEIFFGTQVRKIDVSFLTRVKKRDLLSIHLGIAREKISRNQRETLEMLLTGVEGFDNIGAL